MSTSLFLLLLSCCCTMMRFPENTLRTGVNTWTPTRKVEPLCPPVLWHSNYPLLIANTNISPQSNFPFKVMKRLHKPFYWHREVGRGVHMGGSQVSPMEVCVRRGRERLKLKVHLPHLNTWPNEAVLFGELTDTESRWRMPTTPRFGNLFNVPPPTPGILQFPTNLSVQEPLTRSNMTSDPLMQNYIGFFKAAPPPHLLVHCYRLALQGHFAHFLTHHLMDGEQSENMDSWHEKVT